MTNAEILKKAIKKVQKNGLDCELSGSGNVVKMFRGKDETNEMPTIFEFIFSHEFAKAFWSNNFVCIFCGQSEYETKETHTPDIHERTTLCVNCGVEAMDKNEFPEQGTMLRWWQYHLQQMVLEEEPLKYLEKFL